MRVLVLDGNENQAVACVRSLGRAGYEVLVGASTNWSKAGWSRYCARQFRYTAPQRDAALFVDEIAQAASQVPGTLVLPMTERTTVSLSRRAAGRGRRKYVLPDHETLLPWTSARPNWPRHLVSDAGHTLISEYAEAEQFARGARFQSS